LAATTGQHPVARRLARAVQAAVSAALVGASLLVAGFVVFALSIPRTEPTLDTRAEGVVALTGGSDRVLDGAQFLARGQARRLLITGVNRATGSAALARLLPLSRDLFECCVDLGYQALDTAGNARETREWTITHNISHSLIVVTSNYHMPRALLELSAALPGVTLHPFPVVSDHVDVNRWSRELRVARLVAGEYIKYIGALVRIELQPESSGFETAPLRRDASPP
jgi:uncharacterized SAM-binding protein YcdF (DUF218 family)